MRVDMRLGSLLILFLGVSLPICLALNDVNLDQEFAIRNMTYADINDTAATVLAAFDPGAMWTYLYQFRDTFPNYHSRCVREDIEGSYLELNARGSLMVLSPPGDKNGPVRSIAGWAMMTKGDGDRDAEVGTRRRAASFLGLGTTTVAQLLSATASQVQVQVQRDGTRSQSQSRLEDDLGLPCSLHLDMNVVRAVHLLRQVEAADKEYIQDAHDHQLYLASLATHPDWDGHGFAAAQVQWGMRRAEAEEQRLSRLMGEQVKVPVTLLATPAGYPLYKSLGFESVSNVTFTLLDGWPGGTTWFEYMRWFSEG